MGSAPLSVFEHIVVLMLENRSFDNVLGWLYDPAYQFPLPPDKTFNGVYGKNLTNPQLDGTPVPVGKESDPTQPNPDPGEPYQDVYCQLYGVKRVPALAQVPPNPPQPPAMNGFVYNYTIQEHQPTPATIMQCLTPEVVPVLSHLAYHYGACDHWFASIPTQTLCNRSFLHAGTSSGYVDNGGEDGVVFVNDTPTIFNLLQAAGRSWKIFCASWTVTSLALLTQQKLWDFYFQDGYFFHLRDFFHGARQPGGLPHYSFIEPIYIDSLIWGPENDMHPEAAPYELYGPSNVEYGELLVYEIYQAIRQSPDWENTLLIILFDEHGGTYDHVAPLAAVPPGGSVLAPSNPGYSGFEFNRLGVRVPAIVISPYTDQQTILHESYDHTVVPKTVANCFGLPNGQLGQREAAAPDLSAALTRNTPRRDLPLIPQPAIKDPTLEKRAQVFENALLHSGGKPISELQRRILAGAVRRLGAPPAAPEDVSQVTTALEADRLLMKIEWDLARQKRSRARS
ncbi:MAG: alkaline phosphatase family protein [Terriglobales bacterium]